MNSTRWNIGLKNIYLANNQLERSVHFAFAFMFKPAFLNLNHILINYKEKE